MRGVIIGIATLLVAGAAAQPVAFPLRFYSFEEIAQRMSVGGRRIECAPNLKQRLALIHLKRRDWSQTRALLEAGLDIRLRKTSDADNRWILERNPETLRAERRQREQFAQFLEREATRRRECYQVLLDPNVSPEDAARQLTDPDGHNAEGWGEYFADTARFLRGAPIEQARRNWRAYQRLREAVDFKLENDAIQTQIQKLFHGTSLNAWSASSRASWSASTRLRPTPNWRCGCST